MEKFKMNSFNVIGITITVIAVVSMIIFLIGGIYCTHFKN